MNDNLPYFHEWERAAAKQLAELQFLLSCGAFRNAWDLSYKLGDLADHLGEQYGGLLDRHDDPLEPGPPDDFWRMKR